jgi:Ca-activated chloride channel family protein
VLSHITVDYGDFNVYDLDLPSIPDVTGKRPIIVYGKWKGKKNGTITVKGDAAGGALTFTHSIEAAPSLPEHSALRYLWAKNKITLLEDEQNAPAITGATIDYKKEITDLGLRYNMLTKYTSFIAIDESIRVCARVWCVF